MCACLGRQQKPARFNGLILQDSFDKSFCFVWQCANCNVVWVSRVATYPHPLTSHHHKQQQAIWICSLAGISKALFIYRLWTVLWYQVSVLFTSPATAGQCDVICSHDKFTCRRPRANDKHNRSLHSGALSCKTEYKLFGLLLRQIYRTGAHTVLQRQTLHALLLLAFFLRDPCDAVVWCCLLLLLLLHLMAAHDATTHEHTVQTWLIVGWTYNKKKGTTRINSLHLCGLYRYRVNSVIRYPFQFLALSNYISCNANNYVRLTWA